LKRARLCSDVGVLYSVELGLGYTDTVRSILDVAEDRSLSLFIIPLEANAVGVGRDNQTIDILWRSELVLECIISERQS
jgi:hypothetical protein